MRELVKLTCLCCCVSPPFPPLPPPPASLPHTLTLTLDESQGYYVLGPPSSRTHMFTLSLTLHSPTNLPAVSPGNSTPSNCRYRSNSHPTSPSPSPQPPTPTSRWYFYYNLLGNDITSESFLSSTNSPSFRPECASIRVKSSRELLSLLLVSQEELKVKTAGHTYFFARLMCHVITSLPSFSPGAFVLG